nr:MAG TPA: hypothetical protein [Caudoviricetes sp.]DAY21466.1 MAG TPA: hypothetical protein [Caudoviricetes sp.]
MIRSSHILFQVSLMFSDASVAVSAILFTA